MVTIDEIRRIGQPPEKIREENSYGCVLRKVSPYLVKFFVEHNISANQISLFGILLGVIGSFLFVFGNPYLMLIGCLLNQLRHLFDRVDGEVARVTNSKTVGGAYLERIQGTIVNTFLFVYLGIGLYMMLGNIVFILFGFTFALFASLGGNISKSGELVMEKFNEKPYVSSLAKKHCTTGRIYRIERKTRTFFMGATVYLVLAGIVIFELVSPIKLSCTIHGVTLTVLSAYFFLCGFESIARTIIPGITLYRYFMRRKT